jgi:hypothetical protein
MVFNTTFSNISDISWRSVHWWRKSEYLEKTTDLSQVTDKLHNVVSSTHRHEWDSNSQYYLSMTSINMYYIIVINKKSGAVVAVIVQLPMQSVPITTDVLNSNLDQGEVYNIM